MNRRTHPGGDRFYALRTFRRDGSAVVTPIWLAPAHDRWYAYTPRRSWKVGRIRRSPRIEVAVSDFHGQPLGSWCTGRARILPSGETRLATQALTSKYGNQFRFFRVIIVLSSFRQHGGRAVGLEITLDQDPSKRR